MCFSLGQEELELNSHFGFLHVSGESAVLSFVNWLTLSGAEQSGQRGPSTENQEAKQAAIVCIRVSFRFQMCNKHFIRC